MKLRAFAQHVTANARCSSTAEQIHLFRATMNRRKGKQAACGLIVRRDILIGEPRFRRQNKYFRKLNSSDAVLSRLAG